MTYFDALEKQRPRPIDLVLGRSGGLGSTLFVPVHQPGVPVVTVGAKEFMCMGAKPPFDHPHIFIDMGDDGEAICSYCSTRFVYD